VLGLDCGTTHDPQAFTDEDEGRGAADVLSDVPLIIRLIIQTIRRDPSGPVWIDEAPIVSRPDPSVADQIDAEHQSTDLAIEGGACQSRCQSTSQH
jgi:hypothetical protein